MNIFQKLIEIRKSVTKLHKDTVGYKYKYVCGNSVLTPIREKMDELGVLLIPIIESYETETQTSKYIIKCNMIMQWLNSENPEDKLDVKFACFGCQDDISKSFGSALTYSERYFLLKFFNIPTDEDDPDVNQSEPIKPKKTTAKIENPYNNQVDIFPNKLICADCNKPISVDAASYSFSKYNKKLCFDCQKKNTIKI